MPPSAADHRKRSLTNEESHRELLCPSSECSETNRLLGYVRPDGRVERFPEPVAIDRATARAAAHDAALRLRLRFVGPCAQGGCRNWGEGKCKVAALAVAAASDVGILEKSKKVRPCSIRSECRWFYEQGPAACKACEYVVTELMRAAFEPS